MVQLHKEEEQVNLLLSACLPVLKVDFLFLRRGKGNGTPLQYSFAWKIPWTEEPGRLQSMGSRRVGHDWATSPSLFTFMHWRRKWQPTPVFLPGESQGQGAWWAAVYGVAQSRTRLTRLSSSKCAYKLECSLHVWVMTKSGHNFLTTFSLHVWVMTKSGHNFFLLFKK